jgi:SHS2 domain-containing protein
MSESPYVELEHTADWSLRIRAQDMEGLLRNAAEGMFQLMQLERGDNLLRESHLVVEAHDREELLVNWLEELLFAIEIRGVAFDISSIAISIDPLKCQALLDEYPIEKLEKEIKAVTYHGLTVTETELGFDATLVFDV